MNKDKFYEVDLSISKNTILDYLLLTKGRLLDKDHRYYPNPRYERLCVRFEPYKNWIIMQNDERGERLIMALQTSRKVFKAYQAPRSCYTSFFTEHDEENIRSLISVDINIGREKLEELISITSVKNIVSADNDGSLSCNPFSFLKCGGAAKKQYTRVDFTKSS